METILKSEIGTVLQAVHYRPAISIILPFEPKMSAKAALAYALKTAADKVERELKNNYPEEIGQLVMLKLRTIIKNLNYNTHKKSIAVFVSPVFEKVLYLDITVEEKIIVDESFEIRDLVYSKKQLHKYLVLLLSGNESKMYIGNTTSFIRIVSNTPESVYAYVNDIPERVANFSDMAERKEVMMEKFLRHIDKSLGLILQSHQLPLFVLGTERILGHFKKITKHAGAVIDYLHGNYEETSFDKMKDILAPLVADWKKVKEKDLMNQLISAAGNNKLAVGMKEVWRAAMSNKARLLVVEKNYMYAAEHGSRSDIIYPAQESYNKFSNIKDAVDDVIEKVLVNGGDVEFVDEGVLKDFDRIVLLQYY